MEGISNNYIESILKPTCVDFHGVFSANTIPIQLLQCQTFSFVCNFSRAAEPGSHFVTIISLHDRVLYLDSLALPCLVREITTFLRRLGKPVFSNSQRVQDLTSKFCGFYCILFVLYFNSKEPRFQLLFETRALLVNDSTCIEYIQRLLK